MKVALLPVLYLALTGNFAHLHNSTPQQQKTKADVAMDKVAEVPEVKAFLKEHTAQKAMLLLQGEPTQKRKYYWISLGISNAQRFRPTEHFYVDSNTLQVFYLDIFISEGRDKILTLKDWHRLRKTAGWQKIHYYKNGQLIIDKT